MSTNYDCLIVFDYNNYTCVQVCSKIREDVRSDSVWCILYNNDVPVTVYYFLLGFVWSDFL